MRIAFLNTYGNGSTGKIVDLLKKLAAEKGAEVRSYYSRDYCASPETSKRFFSKIGFYCDALMTRVFDNHGLNSVRNTRRLLSDLSAFKPDIVHIHNLHGYWINYPLLFGYLKTNNIKVILTLHDCWAFTGHCTHFDFVKCDKWKDGCFSCPQKNLYPKALIFDNSKRNYRKKKEIFTSLPRDHMMIVTPSEWLKEKVRSSFLCKYDCKVINNGIDTMVFRPKVSKVRDDFRLLNKFVVLSVASCWDERKGLKFFIECAKARPDWSFVYIGKDKDEHNDIPANVIHIERTDSQDELADWYSAADVFFNPTLEDTYPTTNLESIAAGTPVVTFDVGGSPEIILKTGFGIVTKERTAQSLLRLLETAAKTNYSVGKDISYLLDYKTAFAEKYLELYASFSKGGE